ncbi:MAG: hypothetical protein ABSA79_10460 [Candidatus Bathyarchaeia archaeon]|jgi:hypothetical protein
MSSSQTAVNLATELIDPDPDQPRKYFDELEEIALTEQDVLTYNLPRNPDKPGDSRAKWFAEKYPNVKYSVELDALSPQVLRAKIHTALQSNLDMVKLRAHQEEDERIRAETKDWLNRRFGE